MLLLAVEGYGGEYIHTARDNAMIDYDRSSDRKGFNFDWSIPKFGIVYDRNKHQKGCVLTRLPFLPKTVPENARNITYLEAEIAITTYSIFEDLYFNTLVVMNICLAPKCEFTSLRLIWISKWVGSRSGHVKKLPVTWGSAVVFAGYSSFLHQFQLAGHKLAAVCQK